MSCGAGWFSSYVRNREHSRDILQRRRDRARQFAEDAERQVDPVDRLHNDVAELKLVVATVLDMLLDKGVLTEKELLARSEELDLLDGVKDGMLHGKVDPGGTILPDAPPEATDLDDLAQAARDAESEPR